MVQKLKERQDGTVVEGLEPPPLLEPTNHFGEPASPSIGDKTPRKLEPEPLQQQGEQRPAQQATKGPSPQAMEMTSKPISTQQPITFGASDAASDSDLSRVSSHHSTKPSVLSLWEKAQNRAANGSGLATVTTNYARVNSMNGKESQRAKPQPANANQVNSESLRSCPTLVGMFESKARESAPITPLNRSASVTKKFLSRTPAPDDTAPATPLARSASITKKFLSRTVVLDDTPAPATPLLRAESGLSKKFLWGTGASSDSDDGLLQPRTCEVMFTAPRIVEGGGLPPPGSFRWEKGGAVEQLGEQKGAVDSAPSVDEHEGAADSAPPAAWAKSLLEQEQDGKELPEPLAPGGAPPPPPPPPGNAPPIPGSPDKGKSEEKAYSPPAAWSAEMERLRYLIDQVHDGQEPPAPYAWDTEHKYGADRAQEAASEAPSPAASSKASSSNGERRRLIQKLKDKIDELKGEELEEFKDERMDELKNEEMDELKDKHDVPRTPDSLRGKGGEGMAQEPERREEQESRSEGAERLSEPDIPMPLPVLDQSSMSHGADLDHDGSQDGPRFLSPDSLFGKWNRSAEVPAFPVDMDTDTGPYDSWLADNPVDPAVEQSPSSNTLDVVRFSVLSRQMQQQAEEQDVDPLWANEPSHPPQQLPAGRDLWPNEPPHPPQQLTAERDMWANLPPQPPQHHFAERDADISISTQTDPEKCNATVQTHEEPSSTVPVHELVPPSFAMPSLPPSRPAETRCALLIEIFGARGLAEKKRGAPEPSVWVTAHHAPPGGHAFFSADVALKAHFMRPQYRTKAVSASCSPRWNESFTLPLAYQSVAVAGRSNQQRAKLSPLNWQPVTLLVTVHDVAVRSKEVIGQAVCSLRPSKDGKPLFDAWVPLSRRDGMPLASPKNATAIHMRVTYGTKEKSLREKWPHVKVLQSAARRKISQSWYWESTGRESVPADVASRPDSPSTQASTDPSLPASSVPSNAHTMQLVASEADVAGDAWELAARSRRETVLEADVYARLSMEMRAQGFVGKSKQYIAECVELLRQLDASGAGDSGIFSDPGGWGAGGDPLRELRGLVRTYERHGVAPLGLDEGVSPYGARSEGRGWGGMWGHHKTPTQVDARWEGLSPRGAPGGDPLNRSLLLSGGRDSKLPSTHRDSLEMRLLGTDPPKERWRRETRSMSPVVRHRDYSPPAPGPSTVGRVWGRRNVEREIRIRELEDEIRRLDEGGTVPLSRKVSPDPLEGKGYGLTWGRGEFEEPLRPFPQSQSYTRGNVDPPPVDPGAVRNLWGTVDPVQALRAQWGRDWAMSKQR